MMIAVNPLNLFHSNVFVLNQNECGSKIQQGLKQRRILAEIELLAERIARVILDFSVGNTVEECKMEVSHSSHNNGNHRGAKRLNNGQSLNQNGGTKKRAKKLEWR